MIASRYLLLFFFAFSAFSLSAQAYKDESFGAPVNGNMKIVGTFGELRPNHFHAGADIKGPIGQPVFSVADGYVSRIKVESAGYGKALYITHPNGYTSVYAHLDKFVPEIEAFVKKRQEQEKKFELNIYPGKGQFSFQKGDQVGKLGMKGYAFGPHLHFEIRETASEKPVNPFLFGLDYTDNVEPRLHLLKVYALNPKHQTLFTQSFNLINRGDTYKVGGDTISVGAWRVGLGIKAYDHMTGVPNWNGFYSLEMYVDEALKYSFNFDKYAFNETRYINAHLDYEEQTTQKSYINRCYRLPGNRLSIYNKKEEDGVIALSKTQAKKVRIVVKDIHGNQSQSEFWLKRKEVQPPNFPGTYNYFLPHTERNVVKTATSEMYFPQGCFYEDVYMRYNITDNAAGNCFSAMHHVHEPTVPVHKYYDLAIMPEALPKNSLDKAFIAYCDEKNEYSSYGGTWKNGKLNAQVRSFGDFCIMVDEVPPTIRPIAFKNDMRGYNKMTFKITDNIEVTGRARDLRYEAAIDGRWILMEYDLKNDMLIHRFDEKTGPGEHELVLKVWDDRDNETVFQRRFLR